MHLFDNAGMNIRWKPNVTVAAVIEHEGRFLLVEEVTSGGLRLNNPAGHLEPGESLAQGCAREVLEETAHQFSPTALVGVYMARVQRAPNNPGNPGNPDKAGDVDDVTYLRFAYCGTLGAFDPARALDTGIVRTLWMTPDEIRQSTARHRSPLVLQCMEDYLKGRCFPMELVFTDDSIVTIK